MLAPSPERTTMLPEPVETSTCGTPVTLSVRSKRPSSSANARVVRKSTATTAGRKRCLFRMSGLLHLRRLPFELTKEKRPVVSRGVDRCLLYDDLLSLIQAGRDFCFGAV